MKEPIDTINAAPSKRLFLSIISDYDLSRSICELVDNALDNWVRNGKKATLRIHIAVDFDQQTISVTDDSGGLPRHDLGLVVGPGQTGNQPSDNIIGIFGVGTKRAVVALAQDIQIVTRHRKKPTYMVEFDDDWLGTEDWEMQVYRVDSISRGSTHVFLRRLRNKVDEEQASLLKDHLSRTYATFLSRKHVIITLNSEELQPVGFENWAYPPSHPPQRLSGAVTAEDGKTVRVRVLAGLTKESSPAGGEYGAYFYCNGRLIASEVKSFQVGFATGLAGLPHPSVSLVRVIVSLRGRADLMPWNSSKSDIDYNHKVFQALRNSLVQTVKHWAAVSRAFQGQWPQEVFRHKSGQITARGRIDFGKVKNLRFPPVPRSKPRFADKVYQKNKSIVSDKPWTQGLLDGVVTADMLMKKKALDQGNRISLIVLDSTLEIAFKEYLVNESGQRYSDKRLRQVFQQRHLVHQEVKKYATLKATAWKKINHYYRLRCKLVHERASGGLGREEIADYRSVVEGVLRELFGFEFA